MKKSSIVFGIVVVLALFAGGLYTMAKLGYIDAPAESVDLEPEVKPIDTDEASPIGLGQSATILGVTITPLRLIQDSRCAEGVTCIWAGTVELRVRLDGKSIGIPSVETVLVLGAPYAYKDKQVTLDTVSPAPKWDEVTTPDDYRFTFSIKK